MPDDVPFGQRVSEFEPVTFVERGVAVDFTTPALTQARLRPTPGRKPELVVNNLSGGRGNYIIAWPGIFASFSLTLHDRLLLEALGQLPGIDPYVIRQVSQTVAAEGAAGDSAADLAHRAMAATRDATMITQLMMIVALARAAGASDMSLEAVIACDEVTKKQIRATIRAFAPAAKLDPETIFANMEALAEIVQPIGFAGAPVKGRLRTLADGMTRCRDEILACAGGFGDDADRNAAQFVAAALDVTLSSYRIVAGKIDEELGDIVRLMQRFMREEGALRERLTRCSWILDGWDFIVSLWRMRADEPDRDRAAAIHEMVAYVPAIPREVFDWVDTGSVMENKAWRLQRRYVRGNEDWRMRTSFLEIIKRNEDIKALTG